MGWFSNAINSVSNVFNGARNTISNVWSGVKDTANTIAHGFDVGDEVIWRFTGADLLKNDIIARIWL